MPRISNLSVRKLNQVLHDNGVDLDRFEINNNSEHIWIIKHEPTKIHFIITKRDKDYQVKRFYSDKMVIPPINLNTFDLVIDEFKKWTAEIWADISTDINPISSKKGSFSQTINEISPKFTRIYNQGLRAESMGLDEISGFGFRKALEFLIKDYLISKTAKKSHDFITKHKSIVNCMRKFPEIIDTNILGTGERAFWLGNDHSHYYVKHDDLTIEDLKELVRLCVHWIEQKERTEDYKKRMP